MTMQRPIPPRLTPLPDNPSENERAIWHSLRALESHMNTLNIYLSTFENEAKKDGSTDLSGTVNSGDATTDDVIEAIRSALVLNNLGTN